MFRYEINIAFAGKFWGRVDLHDDAEAKAVDKALELTTRFPAAEGWSITLMQWARETGRTLYDTSPRSARK